MPTLTKDVINIDENDDESPSKRRRVQPATDLSYVDLDDDDSPVLITDPTRDQVIDIEGLELELELLEIEDSKSIEQKPTFNAGINRFENYRNAPVVLPWSEIASTKFKDSFLKVGKTVEMKQGGFLYVQKIIQNRLTGSILLRGWKLIRTNNLDGLLPRKLNELCFIHEVDLDDPRPLLEQSVQEVSVADVCKIRKLLKTNKLFPACRFDPSSAGGLNTVEARKFYIMENEVLTVRWRYITTYETAYERLNFEKKYRRRQLEALEDDECTPGYTESRETRLMDWRSESPKGGPVEPRVCLVCQKTYNSICGLQEHPYDIPQSETISLSANSGSYNIDLKNKPSKAPPRKKQYTFGDTFCGAGGMTRAAVDAGFKIKYGIDSDSNPMETWTHNFPDATPYVCEVQKFVSSPGDRSAKQVDVLHISPPCQYFSPVHTVPGKNDEMNFAALYAVCELLKETRPRIVTLEQTFGITWLQKFDYAFKSLIHMFTQLGFSVSWQVALFQNFGLAQHRKRLIIVAAAPGEMLPDFPEHTHSKDGIGRLKPYASVRSVINSVPRGAANHDGAAGTKGDYVPWDASGIVPCITCGGGERRSHPDGHRLFTHRELAALQGFPHHHEFRGKDIKRQIGNAVPPCVGVVILRSVREHLERVDGNRGASIVID